MKKLPSIMPFFARFFARRWPIALAFFCPIFLFSQDWRLPVPFRKGQLFGLADPNDGRILLEPTLDSVGFFESYAPLAWAKKGQFFGLVNRLGEVVLPFEEAVPFEISVAAKGFFSTIRPAVDDGPTDEGDGSGFNAVAFFDSLGRAVGRPFEFEKFVWGEGSGDERGDDFLNPLEPAEPDFWIGEPLQVISKNGKMGLFDLKKAKIIVEPIYKRLIARGEKAALGWLGEGQMFDERPDDELFLIDLEAGGAAKKWPDGLELIDIFGQSDRLFLAQNRASGLFGYVDRAGKTAIDFVFSEAQPFSKSGLSRAKKSDGSGWRVIDASGRDSIFLGETQAILRDEAGNFWTKFQAENQAKSDGAGDGFFRKKDSGDGSDPIGAYGFEALPDSIESDGRTFWQGRRSGLFGLLDSIGAVVVPFEMERIELLFRGQKGLFRVQKSGRSWLFDGLTAQLLRPKFDEASGLFQADAFEKSNFEMLELLAGDSLFSIKIDDGLDVLNAKTGRRWFLKGADRINFVGHDRWPRVEIYGVDGLHEFFTLDGRLEKRGRTPRFSPKMGRWSYDFDQKTGLTTVLDSAARPICSLQIPFEGVGNDLRIDENAGSKTHPLVIVAFSPEGRTAVFSMAGEALSSPFLWKARVSGDLIFAEMWSKKGVFRLGETKKPLLKFEFESIYERDGLLRATDFEGTERRFDRRGRLVFEFPKNFRSVGEPSEGLQQIVSASRQIAFLDARNRLAFSLPDAFDATAFSDCAAVAFPRDTSAFFFDRTGRRLFDRAFRRAENFQNERAIVQNLDKTWAVIDRSGNEILRQTGPDSPYDKPIFRISDWAFERESDGKSNFHGFDGRELLSDCACYDLADGGREVRFFKNSEYGRLSPDGSKKPLGAEDFEVLERLEDGEKVRIEGFNCEGEGFRKADGTWLVAPVVGQYLDLLGGQFPYFLATAFRNAEKTAFFDRKTGKKLALEPFNEALRIEGLGWHLIRYDGNLEPISSFLYPSNFVGKRAVPADWQILFDEDLGCFSVSVFDEMGEHLVGYIARNGRFLFEN